VPKKESEELISHRRIGYLSKVAILLFLVLLVQLWRLQIVKGDEYVKLAEENFVRFVYLSPQRGMIVDRNGVVLARDSPRFYLRVRPGELADKAGFARDVARIVGMEPEEVLRRLGDVDEKGWAVVKRDLERAEAIALEEWASVFAGISVETGVRRSYPFAEAAGNLTGYIGKVSRKDLEVGYRLNDIIGKAGVELIYEEYLKGEKGGEEIVVNARGRKIKTLRRIEPIPGDNVVLTIDAELQKYCYELMGEKSGAVVVMDVNTGGILALVSKPSYDPNIFALGLSREEWEKLANDPSNPLQNRPLQGEYPPGSTFKVVVAAAALEARKVNPNEEITCTGSYRLGKWNFVCWKREGHGPISFIDAMAHSCDVYFYKIGERVGIDGLYAYGAYFGLGQKTGIDLPGEHAGLMPNPGWKRRYLHERWFRGDTLNLSIGQGYLLVTPLQIASLYGAIANGGYLLQPHVLDKIVTCDGNLKRAFKRKVIRRVPLSDTTLKLIKKSLEATVDYGTGRTCRIKGLKICGKTGTAQNPHGEDHAWFAAFAPADEPRYVVAVLVEHGGHGGETAAPIARKIFLHLFGIEEENDEPLERAGD